jgi:hypothetical protein
MRKNLVLATLLLVVTSSSAMAQSRHHEQYRDRNGNWIAPLVGGVILGAIIESNRQPVYVQPPTVYVQPPVQYQYLPPARTVYVQPPIQYVQPASPPPVVLPPPYYVEKYLYNPDCNCNVRVYEAVRPNAQ